MGHQISKVALPSEVGLQTDKVAQRSEVVPQAGKVARQLEAVLKADRVLLLSGRLQAEVLPQAPLPDNLPAEVAEAIIK